jgi:hypothetical protein
MSEKQLSLYTDRLRSAIEDIPEHFLLMTEAELRNLASPSWKLYQLKQSFWKEFVRAEKEMVTMINTNIYRGIYNKKHYYEVIMNSPIILAWMILPLVEYEDKVSAALHKASDRYDELINMEITTTKKVKDKEAEGGFRFVEETDPRKALVLLQTLKNLEERVKGAALQRQVSITANSPSDGGGDVSTLDMDKIDERMIELERKLNPHARKGIEDGEENDEEGLVASDGDTIEVQSKRVE